MKNNFATQTTPIYLISISGVGPRHRNYLNVPVDEVDVNVHPNKLDVKFENNNLIFGAFYNPISETLQKLSSQVREYKSEEEIVEPKINLNNLQTITASEGYQFNNEIKYAYDHHPGQGKKILLAPRSLQCHLLIITTYILSRIDHESFMIFFSCFSS